VAGSDGAIVKGSSEAIALREELLGALGSWGIETDEGLRDDTSLIRSGLLDSLTLFNLASWIEEQIGAPVEPSGSNLVEEWDTVTDILRFVERRGRSRLATSGDE
jgi:acyl carrier protein